jgi:hypothetical protein
MQGDSNLLEKVINKERMVSSLRLSFQITFSAPIQTGHGTTQPPIKWEPGFSSGGIEAGAWSYPPAPHLVPRLKRNSSMLSLWAFIASSRTNFTFNSLDTYWALTLREECRLRVLENKVLRRIFGPKRDEITGEWRRLHNKELYALYSSPHIIRVIKSRRLRWAGHVARMGERRGAYKALVGKPEERRLWKTQA